MPLRLIHPDLRPRLTVVGAICLLAALFGCLAVYNATYHLPRPLRFVGRQLLWALVGVSALAVATGIPARWYRRYWWALMLIAYVPLWLVTHFGISINGMRGWFHLGSVFIQPSEIAKPAFVVGLAFMLSVLPRHIATRALRYAILLLFFGLWVAPIVSQPDFGALAVYGLAFIGLYWCATGGVREIVVTAIAGVPLVFLAARRHPYVGDRLTAFMAPEEHALTTGWHILQFQRSIASGGLYGNRWGKGLWSQAYLPLGHSDSAFANTAEVVGFIGATAIVGLILVWVWYGQWRAGKLSDDFERHTVLGLTLLLAGQAFIHLSVNLGLLPPTGITLPLVSYGGSSLVSTMVAVGIVESIATGKAQDDADPPPEPTPDGVDGDVPDAAT